MVFSHTLVITRLLGNALLVLFRVLFPEEVKLVEEVNQEVQLLLASPLLILYELYSLVLLVVHVYSARGALAFGDLSISGGCNLLSTAWNYSSGG